MKFVATGKKGEMTAEQKAYYREMSAVLDQTQTISIKVVQNDKSVTGDRFSDGTMDVSDMAAVGNKNKAATTASFVDHSIVEQNAKQKDGITNYNVAHDLAIKAEARITGYLRYNAGQTNVGTLNSKGEFSGAVTLPYYKLVGFSWGMPIAERKDVTLYLTDNNITKSVEK